MTTSGIPPSDGKSNDIQHSQQVAKVNIQRIVRSLPVSLAKREENLQSEYKQRSGSDLENLAWLFAFMDELNGVVDQHTPCKAGCSACCHYAVMVSEIEVRVIEANTSHRRAESRRSVKQAHGTPCPFLRQDRCSIYAVRPFTCRRHVTLDATPKWCATDVCNDVELKQIRFSEVAAVFDELRQRQAYGDIREWFGPAEDA